MKALPPPMAEKGAMIAEMWEKVAPGFLWGSEEQIKALEMRCPNSPNLLGEALSTCENRAFFGAKGRAFDVHQSRYKLGLLAEWGYPKRGAMKFWVRDCVIYQRGQCCQ